MRIHTEDIKTTTPNVVIECSINYQAHGFGSANPRGYYLSVLPVEIDQAAGMVSRITVHPSKGGSRTFVMPVERRSTKRDAEAFNLAKPLSLTMVSRCLEIEELQLGQASFMEGTL